MGYTTDNDNCTIASATRFQRIMIAILSILAVLFKTPIPVYFIIFTSSIAIFVSLQAELLRLFYNLVLKRLLGRDLFSFNHIYPGSFLLDAAPERFIFIVIAIFQLIGLGLYHLGVKWWVIPVAIVAAGNTLSATTGICLMAFMYAMTMEWRKRSLAG